MEQVQDAVKEYYGKVLEHKGDLKTNAACTAGGRTMPCHVRKAAANVHDEVLKKYYGCGVGIPSHLENMHVLDLGSGSGRDCYVLAQLVGPMGHVTGVDMTEEQLAVARKYEEEHRQRFGYEKKNTKFVTGYIERLGEAGLADNSFDIIISNCVINLCADKKAVLEEAFRVLKDGGELYFSDMYSDQVLPERIRQDKVLWGEGMAGALYWTELLDLAEKVGFSTPRLYSSDAITVKNPELQKRVEGYKYVSATYRLFKLPLKRTAPCQVTYQGGIAGYETELKFDYGTTFKTGEAVPVSAELASILRCSRYRDQFKFGSCTDGLTQCVEVRLDPIALAHGVAP